MERSIPAILFVHFSPFRQTYLRVEDKKFSLSHFRQPLSRRIISGFLHFKSGVQKLSEAIFCIQIISNPEWDHSIKLVSEAVFCKAAGQNPDDRVRNKSGFPARFGLTVSLSLCLNPDTYCRAFRIRQPLS